MKTTPFLRLLLLALCLAMLFLGQAHALSSRDRILSGISFSDAEKYQKINVSFNFPVRYLRHYPLNNGKEVRIQFEPIVTSSESRAALSRRESLIPPMGNPAGVERVVYEGNDFVEPTIRVVFEKAVPYEVKQGEDFRSLAVLVPQMKSAGTYGPEPADTVSEKSPTESAAPSFEAKEINASAGGPGALSAQRQEDLLKEGVQVMATKDYSRAVQIYTRLLDSEDEKVLEHAQYQLALAQEYEGHLAHAKAEYKNYLRAFPDGEKAEKARENLKKLLSARPLRFGDSSDTVGRSQSLWDSDFFGSVSVYYDRDVSFPEQDGSDDNLPDSVVNFSTLTTGVDATWRLQSDKYKLEMVAIGSYEEDLEGDDDETRVSSLYLDFEDNARIFTSRLGRQSSSKGGVLGRFDGGNFSYLLTDHIRMNVVAGFPVDRSSDDMQTDKYFYGVNVDLGRFWNHWDFNTYFINQIADDVDDRQAIGGEVRYIGDKGSFFSLIDYDLLFEQVNIILFAGNYLLPNEKTRLNVSADFRRSPSLSSSNALIGQGSPSLEALEDTLGESEMRKLAEDRSLESSYVTLGVSHPLTETVQLAADVSWAKLDGAPASGGVEAIESTGDEFFYTLQLLTDNLFMTGDLSTVSLRYADTKQRDTYTVILNSRLPVTDKWRINPKMQIDYRENKHLSGEQWRLRPSLRLEYSLGKGVNFEIDAEYTWADKELEGIAEDKEGYSVSAGFRWDF